MAKKKGGKGKKGKKEKKPPEGLTVLNEVDKTFFELQITDLNRKLARLRSYTQELEEKNQELELKYSKLDDDRGDIIAYLKRTLQEKQNEVLELQERVAALQESKEAETKEFEAKIEEMQIEYNNMREQLTSEIKLITGKLNALEEFRMQRDELMERFEQQEIQIEEQEIRHKRILYETEKKFILGKDAIKREMELQLFQLAKDFEEANELRIAATTQRVIRENITLNNEINKLTATAERLENENDELLMKNKHYRLNCELFEKERNKALSDSIIQHGVIDELTKSHQKKIEIFREHEVQIEKGIKAERDLRETIRREENLLNKVKVLEQNLHAARCNEYGLQNELKENTQLTLELQSIIYEAIFVIKSAMKIHSDPNIEESLKLAKREDLLSNLLSLMTETKGEPMAVSSLETVPSATLAYKKGDLGFIPKVHTDRKPPPAALNVESQIGRSFEDFMLLQEVSISDKSEESAIPEEMYDYQVAEEKSESIISTTTEEEIGGEESSESDGEPQRKVSKEVIKVDEIVPSTIMDEYEGEYDYEGEYEEEYFEDIDVPSEDV